MKLIINEKTNFECNIYRKENIEDGWCDVELKIDNEYFHYYDKSEALTESEILFIIDKIEEAFMEGRSTDLLKFIEPMYAIKINVLDVDDSFIDMEIRIYCNFDGDYYLLNIDQCEIYEIYEYLCEIMNKENKLVKK